MSTLGEGCRCGASSSGTNRRCECNIDEETETDPLWIDFETCAQAVTVLFRESTWGNLQTAAAATTQLYKSGLDAQRRGIEKGYQAGRQSMAKEVFGILTSSFDTNVLVELLSKNLGAEEQRRARESASSIRMIRNRGSPPVGGDSNAAFHLFHQALAPNPSSSPQRGRGELNAFFASQIQRHRKRARSPSSPSDIFSKKLKRF